MLDSQMIEQLKSVFASLENEIGLVYDSCSHPDQKELLSLLDQVASTSSKIQLLENKSQESSAPQFYISKNKKPTGISFKGIPGGHEFTSLILAILNADGKGKMPDPQISKRIQKIKGPIDIQTYISLTCENCPDVVQALNMMSLVHPNMKHKMIDGLYAQEDIQKLGIQGVPSIVVNGKMIHSGKINLLDLISLLEKTFGASEVQNTESINLGHFDVVVVGGGPAGASAAIYSVRKGLKTALLAERMGGQVQDTKGIENLISVIYTEGPQLAGQLMQHVSSYPVHTFEHRRVEQIEKGSPKKIKLEGGEYLTAEDVIVTTGAKWRELNIPGEKEYIGRGVAFCPHCDGPYYKGKKVSVIGGGNSGVEAAIDLAGIVKEVVLFEFNDQLKADKVLVDKLKSLPNVSIKTNARTSQILGNGEKVVAMEYEDRATKEIKKEELDGVFVQIGLLPNSQFLKGTVELSKFGEIITDEKGRTSEPGIYAAGDVTTTPFKQIIIAMGEGAKAALAAFEDRMKRV